MICCRNTGCGDDALRTVAAVFVLREFVMGIIMAGIDHTKASLDVRSLFSFTKKKTAALYDEMRLVSGLLGCVILSTCNRMELWLSTEDEARLSPLSLLCARLELQQSDYEPFFVYREGHEAVEHLFRLAAGMESQIMGEDQIITQVGDALAMARSCYATDKALEVLFRLAVTGAKRVKTEARFTSADQSVIHAALLALEAEGMTFAGKKCMVIGNGMMGRISAQALLDRDAEVTVTVREYRSGIVDIPKGCNRIGYSRRLELLPDCDLVISATSSPNYTLRCDDLLPLEVDHTIPLIDLAVPRDIDPASGKLSWVRLYDVDSFHISLQTDKLREALGKAEAVLREEEGRFYRWYDGLDLVPQIQRLKTDAAADVSARLTPALRRTRLGDAFKVEMSREVEGASARMMNHLLYGLKARLPEREFRACLDAMEQVLQEKQ